MTISAAAQKDQRILGRLRRPPESVGVDDRDYRFDEGSLPLTSCRGRAADPRLRSVRLPRAYSRRSALCSSLDPSFPALFLPARSACSALATHRDGDVIRPCRRLPGRPRARSEQQRIRGAERLGACCSRTAPRTAHAQPDLSGAMPAERRVRLRQSPGERVPLG